PIPPSPPRHSQTNPSGKYSSDRVLLFVCQEPSLTLKRDMTAAPLHRSADRIETTIDVSVVQAED
ncbi:MAG TPA: hypothetical protein DEG47_31025, partial [Cyanobacteria bacterium UBA11148]|nr:hypothetical protein [Cyanobacteria bacterium UBA11148]